MLRGPSVAERVKEVTLGSSDALRIHERPLSASEVTDIAQAIVTCQNLRVLSLYQNQLDKLEKSILVQLADALAKNQTLERLKISGNLFEVGDISFLVEALYQHKTLRSLKLEGNYIGIKTAESIANLIRNNTILESLDLYDNDFQDEGAQIIFQALGYNSRLMTLDLGNNGLTSDCTQSIVDYLTDGGTLLHLLLTNNAIDGKSFALLSQALDKNVWLVDLNLKGNGAQPIQRKDLLDKNHVNQGLFSEFIETATTQILMPILLCFHAREASISTLPIEVLFHVLDFLAPILTPYSIARMRLSDRTKLTHREQDNKKNPLHESRQNGALAHRTARLFGLSCLYRGVRTPICYFDEDKNPEFDRGYTM